MSDGIEYDVRLIAFVDILGFKNIVSKSIDDKGFLSFIHKTISSISGDAIEDGAYNNLPYLPLDGSKTKEELPVIFPEHPDFYSKARDKWPISVTQFSDCIVISASVNIHGACQLLLRTINELMDSFFDRGILLRGGISIGKIIHESGGILFGPGLIKSYLLESNKAKYPRIVVSHKSRIEFEKLFHYSYLELFRESTDGYYATDVTHVKKLKLLGQGEISFDPIDSKLEDIKNTVASECPGAIDKVKYLSKEWEKRKMEILEELRID